MKALPRLALACLLAVPSGAEVVASAPTVTVSSMPFKSAGRPPARVGLLPAGHQGVAAVGASAGVAEGKPLEVMVWGGAGAIVGSTVGPLGTVVGAAAGSAFGLLFSMFVVPRLQPGMSKKDRASD